VSHHERTLHKRIVGDDVYFAAPIFRRKREQHLIDKMSDDGAVFAARKTNNPRKGVWLQILLAEF
jgi:hypothetical protein